MVERKRAVKGQTGHIALEYVLVTFVLVMFLFAPVTDENQSVMGLLMDAIRDFDTNRSLLYSLP
ncbi:MAG: hypothetical protein KZQ76_14620 [Candidatus Thiodiazotropha sp. (ex Epidulcina cf. delphinae)]|nr:hypothetical protein [Candidatus Thiodiazotropha sp. (ex Epidulcina cf. delphinae)]